ncbi:hypothetical protein ASE91_15780 [Sphingomonas sp. Leaf62]|nr:hypothetical protein ASE91_15780 [Sphingomonas sp. Leaf62]
MLPVSELAKIVRLLSGTSVTGRNRAALLEAAASLPMAAIRKHVVQYLRERYSASSAVFNGEVLGRRITSADLRHLSIWQAAPAQSSDRVDPAAEWLALLSREGAFGPVPEDVQNLLAAG